MGVAFTARAQRRRFCSSTAKPQASPSQMSLYIRSLPPSLALDHTSTGDMSILLFKRHLDSVHAQLKLQPSCGPPQLEHPPILILEPHPASPPGDSSSRADACVVSVEVFQLLQMIDVPSRLRLGNADVRHRQPTDIKGVVLPLVGQYAATP